MINQLVIAISENKVFWTICKNTLCMCMAMNSARDADPIHLKIILELLAIVECSNELPILNFENSLQNSRFLQMFMK
jgi:hypothetical protein